MPLGGGTTTGGHMPARGGGGMEGGMRRCQRTTGQVGPHPGGPKGVTWIGGGALGGLLAQRVVRIELCTHVHGTR